MQDPFGNYVVQYVLKSCSRCVAFIVNVLVVIGGGAYCRYRCCSCFRRCLRSLCRPVVPTSPLLMLVLRTWFSVRYISCLVVQGGDVHALLSAAGTRGFAVHSEVLQQRDGGVLGACAAGSSGAFTSTLRGSSFSRVLVRFGSFRGGQPSPPVDGLLRIQQPYIYECVGRHSFSRAYGLSAPFFSYKTWRCFEAGVSRTYVTFQEPWW